MALDDPRITQTERTGCLQEAKTDIKVLEYFRDSQKFMFSEIAKATKIDLRKDNGR